MSNVTALLSAPAVDVATSWIGTRRAGLSPGLGRALQWAMLEEMEAAVPSPHGKSAPSVQNILAKLLRDK